MKSVVLLRKNVFSSRNRKIHHILYRCLHSSPFLCEQETMLTESKKRQVLDSFGRSTFMSTLGAKITHIDVGEVDIELECRPHLQQHNGYVHAGVSTSIADSAAGYAALTCFSNSYNINGVVKDSEVLTTEFKINLLNPAIGSSLVARGRVIKSGKTLTISKADVYAKSQDDQKSKNNFEENKEDEREIHVLTGLFTLFQTKPKK